MRQRAPRGRYLGHPLAQRLAPNPLIIRLPVVHQPTLMAASFRGRSDLVCTSGCDMPCMRTEALFGRGEGMLLTADA